MNRYQAVSLYEKQSWEEEDVEIIPVSTSNSLNFKYDVRLRLKNNWTWIAHFLLLSLSLSMLIVASVKEPSMQRHMEKYSAWSPAAKVVEYETVKYNVTTDNNRFVGKGPEVDRAWHEICYDMGDQMISPNRLRMLGMPETSIKVDDPKTGEPGYRVGLEVFHQLHCLNLLRKVTHKDYYNELGLLGTDEGLAHHTAHCIEVLRLNLQCQSDVGVFTLYMKEGDPLAWPELNTQHKCRNFDKIKDWAMENTVGIMDNA